MSEAQSKCSGVLAKLKQRPAAASSIARPDPPVGNEPGRGRGRPPGKRSDPDYQPTTVLLRKYTKKTATRLLEDTNAGHDLSDLIEQLLTEWIHRQLYIHTCKNVEMRNALIGFWGLMLQALSEKHNSFFRSLKKKGFKEERVTTIGLYDIDKYHDPGCRFVRSCGTS
jgi:hypothetical protein